MNRHLKRIAIPLAVSLSLLTGCSKNESETEPEPAAAPALVSTSPENGAVDIKGSTLEIVFTFDQNVKSPSSAQSGVTIDSGASVSKIFAYNTDVTVTVANLAEGVKYTLNIPEGTISGYKDNNAKAITYTFTTYKEPVVTRNPDQNLTNANATAKAKALYKFLLDNYGKKTISGTMGGVAWETTCADYIYKQTGTYPGIVGFDFIHLSWSPADWIDYSDITPVKKAHDAGNIIQIGWHWNVPPSKEVTDPNKFSCSKSFGVKEALTDGTWQNTFVKEQIKKLAGYLKLLQDADIPVLFRPLHEAAGDYHEGWGPWFWWGFDGADACIKLWKYLYDSLVKDYGLNNLIWVWTVQTTDAGATATANQAKVWYPGDDYVDIVGADLYATKGTSQSTAFKLVEKSVNGKKMVVLSEFGNLLDIDAYFAEDAPWGYFMNWYSFDEQGNPSLKSESWDNSVDDWKKALNNSHTLNRGDLNQH